jgi:hypothetical protein
MYIAPTLLKFSKSFRVKGKGENLWKALYITKGDNIIRRCGYWQYAPKFAYGYWVPY